MIIEAALVFVAKSTGLLILSLAGVKGVSGLKTAGVVSLGLIKAVRTDYPHGGFLERESWVLLDSSSNYKAGHEFANLAKTHDCLKPFVGIKLQLTEEESARFSEVLVPCIKHEDDESCARVLARWINEHPRKG